MEEDIARSCQHLDDITIGVYDTYDDSNYIMVKYKDSSDDSDGDDESDKDINTDVDVSKDNDDNTKGRKEEDNSYINNNDTNERNMHQKKKLVIFLNITRPSYPFK